MQLWLVCTTCYLQSILIEFVLIILKSKVTKENQRVRTALRTWHFRLNWRPSKWHIAKFFCSDRDHISIPENFSLLTFMYFAANLDFKPTFDCSQDRFQRMALCDETNHVQTSSNSELLISPRTEIKHERGVPEPCEPCDTPDTVLSCFRIGSCTLPTRLSCVDSTPALFLDITDVLRLRSIAAGASVATGVFGVGPSVDFSSSSWQ